MTAKPYEMWSAAAVDSRLSPVEVTVEMSMETTGRLLNVASTCRRRPACQLAGVLRGPLRCSDYSSGDRFRPVRSLPVASFRVILTHTSDVAMPDIAASAAVRGAGAG